MSKTILITNIILSQRSGTEVVVEQLADGLRRRGHRPILFAPLLGPLSEDMRARGHFVTDRPTGLAMRPDLIHGHHIGPTMAAVAAHPGVPALFVSHDAFAAHDALPSHPRIRRIFAVDERCRARLVAEGANPASVRILPNAVDLSRIAPRQPLPARPLRAVVLTKQNAHLPALRTACFVAGIALDEYGHGVGKMVDWPEKIFAEVDLVFATARTALEASAAGAGVVVCDSRGCAGFLTKANAEAWLPYNLGAGILAHPCDVEHVSAAIANWSAEEAVAASALVRDRCGLEPRLDQIEAIYSEIQNEAPSYTAAAEAAAVGNFIADWVPHYGPEAPWRRLAAQVSEPPPGSPIDGLERGLTAVAEKIDALAVAQQETSRSDALERGLTAVAEKIDVLAAAQLEASKSDALERGLTAVAEKIDALAAAQREMSKSDALERGLSAVAAKVDALAAALPETSKIDAMTLGLKALAQKLDAMAETQTVALKAARPSPSLSIRLEAHLRGPYRRVVPLRLRAPFYRFRRRMLDSPPDAKACVLAMMVICRNEPIRTFIFSKC